jgi:hypothetical protein
VPIFAGCGAESAKEHPTHRVWCSEADHPRDYVGVAVGPLEQPPAASTRTCSTYLAGETQVSRVNTRTKFRVLINASVAIVRTVQSSLTFFVIAVWSSRIGLLFNAADQTGVANCDFEFAEECIQVFDVDVGSDVVEDSTVPDFFTTSVSVAPAQRVAGVIEE